MKIPEKLIERTLKEIEREPTKVEVILMLILWIVFVPFILEIML